MWRKAKPRQQEDAEATLYGWTDFWNNTVLKYP